MNNDRAWMYQRLDSQGCLNPAFVNGVENFMEYVISRPSSLDGINIRCPCFNCKNIKFWNAETVKLHLLKKGFVRNYYEWDRHGEPYVVRQSAEPSSTHYSNTQDRRDEDNLMYNMVMDAAGPSFNPEMPNPGVQKLYDILDSSKRELYEGCETSQLSAMAQMLSLKSNHHCDFPAYSMLSGWKTAGHLACPHCAHDHDAYNLSHGGKTTWFDNHRKFLPANHPFRKNKNWFTKGKTVTESAPPVRTGEDVLQEIESLGLMKVTELGSDEHNAKARMRRVMNRTENVPARPGQGVSAPGQGVSALGQSAPAHSGQRVQVQSEQRIPTGSGQHIPAQSKQHVRAHSEQGTGQSRLPIRLPSQSGLHSPTQSRQRTSQSGQSTPNESRQLTAQSRQHTPEAQSRQLQHTPEAQSRQHTISAQSEPVENTPTPSHPSILNVSPTAANGYVRWDIGLEQGDGRVRLEVIKGTLEPSNVCSKRNRLIMYERLEPTGYNWKCLSKETKDFYFEEFKKYFVWRQSDAVIYKGWLANARRKYSEVVSIARGNWENHNRRDNRIGLDVYLSWVEFWKTDDFKKKSSIQKSNRCSGVDGRPSTHTSGSASHRIVAARVKVQYKRDPTADEIFYLTHTRRVKKKKNPIAEAREIGLDDEDVEGGEDDENFEVVWVDQKSQRIYFRWWSNDSDGQEDDGQDDSDGQEDDLDGQEDDSNGQDDN
ncbi:hypothetical protein POM88_036555 [Heracleum sosnowskyi]|uniref:Transposase-associated domain-containing protein n=1 Tax=Heracleum sosnowskyi TaxID=360622 RepID=A0AAD8HPF8_9APIA|nr:hypothetical protein POM88_036555 [Heracleum sosnowskyi]